MPPPPPRALPVAHECSSSSMTTTTTTYMTPTILFYISGTKIKTHIQTSRGGRGTGIIHCLQKKEIHRRGCPVSTTTTTSFGNRSFLRRPVLRPEAPMGQRNRAMVYRRRRVDRTSVVQIDRSRMGAVVKCHSDARRRRSIGRRTTGGGGCGRQKKCNGAAGPPQTTLYTSSGSRAARSNIIYFCVFPQRCKCCTPTTTSIQNN